MGGASHRSLCAVGATLTQVIAHRFRKLGALRRPTQVLRVVLSTSRVKYMQ